MTASPPSRAERYRPFVYVFVPFSLLLAGGNLLYSELSPNTLWGQLFYPDTLAHLPLATTNPTLGRVVFSILLSLVFSVPALVLFTLYDLRTAPPLVYRYWQLFWTFSFVAFAVHAYYATGPWFGWDFRQIVARQTLPVTLTNYVLLAMWGVDVGVSVTRGQGAGGRGFLVFQWVTVLVFVAAAVTAAIVFSAGRTLESLVLGWVIVVAFGYSAVARLLFGPVAAATDDRPPLPRPAAGHGVKEVEVGSV